MWWNSLHVSWFELWLDDGGGRSGGPWFKDDCGVSGVWSKDGSRRLGLWFGCSRGRLGPRIPDCTGNVKLWVEDCCESAILWVEGCDSQVKADDKLEKYARSVDKLVWFGLEMVHVRKGNYKHPIRGGECTWTLSIMVECKERGLHTSCGLKMDIYSVVEAKVRGHALYTIWARTKRVSLNARKRIYVLPTNGTNKCGVNIPVQWKGLLTAWETMWSRRGFNASNEFTHILIVESCDK